MTIQPSAENSFIEKLKASIVSLGSWVEGHDYKGYEPFDALLSPLRLLAFGKPMAERILIQLVRQCPINLRPLIGIYPHDSSMGRGCMAAGYLNMYRCTQDDPYRMKAENCLEWLMKNKSPYSREHTWGHHFDWVSRAGPHPRYLPSIVWTTLIGHTFMDGYELLGRPDYIDVAASISRWILSLPREVTGSGTCISYVSFRQDSIHNSNMLGASFLARYGGFAGKQECLDVAREAMLYSCTRQRPDHSWYYGESPMHQWVDSFHTAYNLDSLKYYLESTRSEEFRSLLINGYSYYKRTFFEEDGLPRYYDTRTYPIDIQCASQAITTLANFAGHDSDSLPLARQVSRWTIDNMQDAQGYFYYRKLPAFTIRTPMLHWAQATMFKGLTLLYAVLLDKAKELPGNLSGTVYQNHTIAC